MGPVVSNRHTKVEAERRTPWIDRRKLSEWTWNEKVSEYEALTSVPRWIESACVAGQGQGHWKWMEFIDDDHDDE